MKTNDSSYNAGPGRVRAPFRVAAVAFSVYMGMYLAFVGIVHVLTAPEATAAMMPGSTISLGESAAHATGRDHPSTRCSAWVVAVR